LGFLHGFGWYDLARHWCTEGLGAGGGAMAQVNAANT